MFIGAAATTPLKEFDKEGSHIDGGCCKNWCGRERASGRPWQTLIPDPAETLNPKP